MQTLDFGVFQVAQIVKRDIDARELLKSCQGAIHFVLTIDCLIQNKLALSPHSVNDALDCFFELLKLLYNLTIVFNVEHLRNQIGWRPRQWHVQEV